MDFLGRLVVVLALSLPGGGAIARDAGEAPYAGLQSRDVKSLSEQDIADLLAGRGWGLALPAELNGRPGPAHVLELREDLGLSAGQVAAITEIFDRMRAAAIAAGGKFIAAEAALDDAFAGGEVDRASLARLLSDSEAARKELRMVHLSAHLSTPGLLTEGQIGKYNVLRGYADDPCATVPEGHDPAMWRKHNGCE